jgi:transketolase C-terminal domain/subunit
LSGLQFKPITISFANFPTLRPFEILRNIPNRYHSNIKIIAVGSGFGSSPQLGVTHFMTDDLAALQSLNYLEIFSPADIPEALAIAEIVTETTGFQCVRLAMADPFPIHSNPLTDTEIQQLQNGIPLLVYKNTLTTADNNHKTVTAGSDNINISSGSNDKTAVSDTSTNNVNIVSDSELNLKTTNTPLNSITDTTDAYALKGVTNAAATSGAVPETDSVAIFTLGPIAATAIQAAQTINPNQKIVEVFTCPKLPLNQSAVQQLLTHFHKAITIEEHIKFGGLGTAIAQIIATQNIQIPLKIIGIEDPFTLPVGDLQYLRQAAGLTQENLLAAIKSS